MLLFDHPDDDDDEDKPIWPTWAIDTLSAARDVEPYNRGHTPVLDAFSGGDSTPCH
jgi:hypothetical protein